jgi:alpha-1,6-mannosyltransferase
MKICDLTQFYSPYSGGVKTYLEQKQRFAVANGHEHILIIPGPVTNLTSDESARTYAIRSPLVSRTSRYRALLNLARVERILQHERPDLIESGDPYQMAWKALAVGRSLRIPVVGFYHSHFPEAYVRTSSKYLGQDATELFVELAQNYVRSLYNEFARTLVSSQGLADVLTSWGVHNLVLNELGVDTEIFTPAQDGHKTRTRLRIPPDSVVLLYVGRLAPEKNVKTLSQAFELLHGNDDGRFHLLIVGDGPLRELVRELADQTGQVTWLPYCADPAELARLYRAADLFVHPSIQETFGLVALESQACGTPVVGIRGSYMDRIIFSDQTQWSADNSACSLAKAICDVAETDYLRSSGKKIRQRVAARYSWNQVFTRLFDLYAELTANSNHDGA